MKFLLFTHDSLKHASLLFVNVFDTPEANRHPSTTAEDTENWDDDFELETQNKSPRKQRLSTLR